MFPVLKAFLFFVCLHSRRSRSPTCDSKVMYVQQKTPSIQSFSSLQGGAEVKDNGWSQPRLKSGRKFCKKLCKFQQLVSALPFSDLKLYLDVPVRRIVYLHLFSEIKVAIVSLNVVTTQFAIFSCRLFKSDKLIAKRICTVAPFGRS